VKETKQVHCPRSTVSGSLHVTRLPNSYTPEWTVQDSTIQFNLNLLKPFDGKDIVLLKGTCPSYTSTTMDSTEPKMEAFRIVRPSYPRRTCADIPQLKPLCVPLMGLRPLTPQTQAIAHSHLVRLFAALQGITNPKEAFTPSLVRYTLFPLTHLLTRNNPAGRKEGEVGYVADRTMEVLFRCLGWIMQRWWESGEEVDSRVWEQLWRMVVLILGGPIGSEAQHEPRAEETIG
jgi:hypothetical protein